MKKPLYSFLLIVALPVLTVLWWWGLFSSASLEVAERGGYRYAYVEATGAYSKLASKQQEVLALLKQQGLKPSSPITVIFSDPRSTRYDKLEARTGYIIETSSITPSLPLKVDTIPKRRVAIAKIKAHPLFAYGKTYSALLDYTKIQHMQLRLPTVETIEASVLTVEMPLESANSEGLKQ